MGFPRQEYWSGLPFPSPGDLPDPGIEHVPPALASIFFTTWETFSRSSPTSKVVWRIHILQDRLIMWNTPLLLPKLKLQYFGHLMQRAGSLEKTLMLGQMEGKRRRGQQRMRWLDSIHRLNGCEFEQTPGESEGQGSLACCSSWDWKEMDTTEWMNNNYIQNSLYLVFSHLFS